MILFLRASSSYEGCHNKLDLKKRNNLRNYIQYQQLATLERKKPISIIRRFCQRDHTVKVCSIFLTSSRRRASSMKGSFAIPFKRARRTVNREKKKILEEETNPVSYCVTKGKQKHNLEDN